MVRVLLSLAHTSIKHRYVGWSESISRQLPNDTYQITEDSLTYVVIIEVLRQDEMKKDFKFNTALYDQNKESFVAEFGDRFIRGKGP